MPKPAAKKEDDMLRRSRHIQYGVALVCAFVAAYASLGAQAPALSQDQQRALQILDTLTKPFPSGDSARDIRWLVESVRSRPNVSLPATVLAGLEANLAAMNRINELPEAQREPVVEAVRADLRLKAEFCRNHPEGMAGQVALNVRTWLAGEPRSEARQWQVVYINAPLAGFAGRKAAPFPQFSSPTRMLLPPGAYILWAQDPTNASRRGPEVLLRLGVARADTLDADLLVASGL
jgi:hypothetical protein